MALAQRAGAKGSPMALLSLLRSPSLLLLLALLVAGLPGCADVPVETDEAVPGEDGKADGTGELRVRAGDTTVWADRLLAVRGGEGEPRWIVSGRASRNLVGGEAFTPDGAGGGAGGAFAIAGPRRFEVGYPAGDPGVLSGASQLVRLDMAPSSTRPDSLTARVVVQPRLLAFSGSGAYLTAALRPVVVGGRVVFRVSGRASASLESLAASVGSLAIGPGELRIVDDRRFTIDLLADQVTELAAGASELVLDLQLSSGARQKRARLGLSIARLGLTTGDPAEVWPAPVCEEAVSQCLQALPAGASDTSACGEALEVLACAGAGGTVVFDDVAFAAAASRGGDAVAAGIAGDADALVGADRAAGFSFAVTQEIEHGLEGLFGQQFPDQAALEAAVDEVIEGAIDRAYARPLDLTDGPHPPAPGSVAGTRQLVADSLLLHLADMDLEQTEFGRPLEELTRLFRARHVADLRAFRTAVSPVTDGQGRQVYIGHWLDPYVEVAVDPATGQVVNVYFEID